jgi:hypothetical protein
MTIVTAIFILCALCCSSCAIVATYFLWLLVRVTAKQDQELTKLNMRPGMPRVKNRGKDMPG